MPNEDDFSWMLPSAGLGSNEDMRVKALRSYAILDTPPDVDFDEISELATVICECPAAYISLVDDTRQWMKSLCGMPESVRTIDRDMAICATTITQHDVQRMTGYAGPRLPTEDTRL